MKTFFVIGLAILVVSCNPEARKQKACKELMEADKAFSQLSLEKGSHQSFLKYIDEDAVLLRPNSYPVEGRKAIEDLYSLSSDTAYTLIWEPCLSNVAFSGELGYTYGVYTLTTASDTINGTYVSIWKKSNGQWKLLLDSGNEGLGKKACNMSCCNNPEGSGCNNSTKECCKNTGVVCKKGKDCCKNKQ